MRMFIQPQKLQTANPHSVRTASKQMKEQVLKTIALGFSADPVARWIWPEPDVYLEAMPRFAEAFGGHAIDAGTAYVAGGYNAASLWLSPGIEPDGDGVERILAETTRSEIAQDLEELFGQMERYHPKDIPCWYLPMIAADPAFVGRGLGAAILKHALRDCDERKEWVYLESSNPRNISLYQRFGFERIGEISAGEAPPMFPMLRPPRD